MRNLNFLLPKTKTLLLDLEKTSDFLNNFTLVGGSAIALYLCHRKSEDLDFFTWSDNFNKKQILDYIKRFKRKEIINESKSSLDLLINGVNLTFFNAKWPFLMPLTAQRLNIAPIEILAAMKVHTLFLRAKYRDYYDLYCMAKEKMSLQDIFKYSQTIIEEINFKLFCAALIYVEDIEDENIRHLEPRFNISKEEIRAFFEKKIKQLV